MGGIAPTPNATAAWPLMFRGETGGGGAAAAGAVALFLHVPAR